LLTPTGIREKTLYVFACASLVMAVIFWAVYPETANRTLEEMDLLFSSDSIWVWNAETALAAARLENPELVHVSGKDSVIMEMGGHVEKV
jgi:hypothetical protein